MAFRRNQLRKAKDAFPELCQPGVYLLLGSDGVEEDLPCAYVGESENVFGRLSYYAGLKDDREQHTFWTETIVFASKDENLTKSHARYIEARLIAEAKTNPRWLLSNTQGPSDVGKLPLPERAAMDEFVDQTKTLSGALGCNLFKASSPPAIEQSALPTPTETAPNFAMKGEGYSAQMSVTSSGEVSVHAGSVARRAETNSIPKGVRKVRGFLLERGLVEDINDGFRFVSDYVFASPSMAAAVIYGGSINGRNVWRLSDGTSYADWEAANAGH